jgi:hypothetical protein
MCDRLVLLPHHTILSQRRPRRAALRGKYQGWSADAA